METDIIVSGFNATEELHGIQYMRLIGDGDSSVKCDIQQSTNMGPYDHKN